MNDETHTPPPIARHAVILCHPDPHSFNHAVADAYCDAVRAEGQEAVLRDLYAMQFDPVLKAHERPTADDFALSADVEAELDILRDCDVFVLVYPIWFGTPPAMMKGYIERVLGSGVNPKAVQARAPTAFLGGKCLLSFTSSATSEPWLNEQGQWESLRYLFDHYLTHAFGMQKDDHIHFANIVSGIEKRWIDQNLYTVAQQAKATCALLLSDWHRMAKQPA